MLESLISLDINCLNKLIPPNITSNLVYFRVMLIPQEVYILVDELITKPFEMSVNSL